MPLLNTFLLRVCTRVTTIRRRSLSQLLLCKTFVLAYSSHSSVVDISVVHASCLFLMASQFEVGKIAEIDARSFAVDPVALQLFPSDAPTHHLPVCVRGGGNCFFRAASLLLTGNEESCHQLLRLETARS